MMAFFVLNKSLYDSNGLNDSTVGFIESIILFYDIYILLENIHNSSRLNNY